MEPDANHTAHAPAPAGESFVHREMNGATFLTLEHVAHMALVVILPLVLIAGVMSALNMWAGLPGITTSLFGSSALTQLVDSSKVVEATLALAVVAALLVLVPALVVLDRRTRAEWHKRPGYAGRLAYKVPVYTALAILGVIKVSLVIELVYIVITSLAYIGIPNAPIGTLYMDSFLPAAISLVILAAAAWYVFNLAKGRDYGRKFSAGVAGLGVAAIVSLLITSMVVLHNGDNSFTTPSTTHTTFPTAPSSPSPTSPYDSQYYQDLFNQYNQ